MSFVLALSGGAWIFAIVIVLFVLMLIFTAYSKAGSGIDAHPTTSQSAPGADREAGLQPPDGHGAEQTFDDGGSR